MDPQFQTSFIPKKPIVQDRVVQTRPVSVLVFLATVIFFASLIAAGIVGFNKAAINRTINEANAKIAEARKNFEDDFIKEVQKTDRRLQAGKEILANHISVAPVFQGIEASTLKNIQFTKFSNTVTNIGQNPKIEVKMTGKADDFQGIALQSRELTKNKYFRDPVFSNLTIDLQKKIVFELTFTVDPHYVNYGEALARFTAAASPDAGSQTPASPQGPVSPNPVPAGNGNIQ